jgi:RNA-directed DNA polymerase
MGKGRSVSKSRSKINTIAEIAQKRKNYKFTSLGYLLDEEYLAECFRELKRRAAPGVDRVTVSQYENKISLNLRELVERLKSREYRPKPVRRVYIDKPGKSEKRPLGIPSIEDKIVQMGIKNILEPIFEPIFLDCSHGFRPNRSCHTAIKQINEAIRNKPINYVVEVDIRRFFDTVDHTWLWRCIEERVADPSFMRIIGRFLKAGIMEAGEWRSSDQGTPQGGIISPLLANIYLHYVLDLWFERRFKTKALGYCELVRYCDDFVMMCQSEEDADRFLNELQARFDKFGLKIAEEKTKKLEFGRNAWKEAQRTGDKVPTFTFLGFLHYCGKSRNGYFMVKHKTAKETLRRKVQAIGSWLKGMRNLLSPKEWWPILKLKMTGHYNYFGINGNIKSLQQYYYLVKRLVYKWINRRSQKRTTNWRGFEEYLRFYPLPLPKIVVQIWENYGK